MMIILNFKNSRTISVYIRKLLSKLDYLLIIINSLLDGLFLFQN